MSVCESDITAGSWFKQGETGKSVPNVYGESDSLVCLNAAARCCCALQKESAIFCGAGGVVECVYAS